MLYGDILLIRMKLKGHGEVFPSNMMPSTYKQERHPICRYLLTEYINSVETLYFADRLC
jgi:hypothetical protein